MKVLDPAPSRRKPRHRRHTGPGGRARPRPGDDRPLAALGRFVPGLRHADQGPDHAGMQRSHRHQAQARDRQRQRTCSHDHFGDSPPKVRNRRRTSSWHRQMAAALCERLAEAADVAEELGNAGAVLRISRQSPRPATRDRRAVDDRRWADRIIAKSWLEEAGLLEVPETWDGFATAARR